MATTRVQGQRDVALSTLPFRGITINDVDDNTTSVEVYASDSGIMFVNERRSETTYTLPSVADCEGKWFIFYCNHASATIKISGTTTDVMNGATTGIQTLADDITCAGVIGNWGVIFGDGDRYYFFAGTGAWTGSG